MGLLSRLIVASLPVIPKPVVGFVAQRYVAGSTLGNAIDEARKLNAEGALVTMDVLGESVPDTAKAEQYVARYKELFDAIREHGIDGNVSIKPTMLGLNLDEAFCREQFHTLHEYAKERGNWITIDMEDHPYTDSTLAIYREMQRNHGNSSTVLQAYMRRTLADIGELPPRSSVRLCKGIYVEPEHIAWKDFHTVRENFRAAVDKLIRLGHYVHIATHDEHLVWAGMEAVDRHGLNPEQYEFQMLLGVRPDLRKLIISQGHRLRVYVPFGPDWYPYSIRRLRENPGVAKHVMRAFFGLR
jgi:proline dehydrogenase